MSFSSQIRHPIAFLAKNSTGKLLLSSLVLTASAHASTITTLPTANTPGGDWTEIVFDGTSMVTTNNSVTMTTAVNRGVWFGNGSNYGDTPHWSLGSNAQGNSLSFTASFSANAVDWSAYLYDGTHYAQITFRPSGCDDNCYSFPGFTGIEIYYRNELNQTTFERFFVDVTQPHTYGFLLKNDNVLYEMDGQALYAGPSMEVPFAGQLLVIGDGSGSTASGLGAMTITTLSIDNSPTSNVPASVVPEPESWAMAFAGVISLLVGRRMNRFAALAR